MVPFSIETYQGKMSLSTLSPTEHARQHLVCRKRLKIVLFYSVCRCLYFLLWFFRFFFENFYGTPKVRFIVLEK